MNLKQLFCRHKWQLIENKFEISQPGLYWVFGTNICCFKCKKVKHLQSRLGWDNGVKKAINKMLIKLSKTCNSIFKVKDSKETGFKKYVITVQKITEYDEALYYGD